MGKKTENATTGATTGMPRPAALRRAMPLKTGGTSIIVGECLTHNAGVGSSSLPPAIRLKSFCHNTLATVFALVLRLSLRGHVTKPATTDLQFAQNQPDSESRQQRIATYLRLRQIERDRELLHIRLAFKSGTLARWER